MTKSTKHQQIIREILLYAQKKNSSAVIEKLINDEKYTKKRIEKIIKANNKKGAPDIFKSKYQEQTEQFGEIQRILLAKISHKELGRELYESMKARHVNYKNSWIADSMVTFNFPDKFFCLALTADFHLGHEGVDYTRLEHDINVISHTPNMYMAFLGDAMDNFIDPVKHQEAVINATTSPKEQAYMLHHVLSILKKPSEKILFVTKDNHVSARLKKATGIDWTNKMWSDLNIFYGGEEVVATLNAGKVSYKIVGRHKYRGGSNINLTSSCKTLLKQGKYGDADIVALAHKHQGAMEMFHYRGTPRIACQASTYKLFDPFAKMIGFDDPNVFMPCIVFNPHEKDYILCSSIDAGARTIKSLNKTK